MKNLKKKFSRARKYFKKLNNRFLAAQKTKKKMFHWEKYLNGFLKAWNFTNWSETKIETNLRSNLDKISKKFFK